MRLSDVCLGMLTISMDTLYRHFCFERQIEASSTIGVGPSYLQYVKVFFFHLFFIWFFFVGVVWREDGGEGGWEEAQTKASEEKGKRWRRR